MLTKIAGLIRGLAAANYPEGDEYKQMVLNNRGDQIVAPGLPKNVELVRLGGSWQVKTATAFAPLTTEPTTTAGLSLANLLASGGPSIIIEEIGIWERVIDATQQNQLALFAMLNPFGSALPSAGTLLTTPFKSLSGRTGQPSGLAARDGATVVDDGWFAHGNSGPSAGAVAGGAWRVTADKIEGLYIVPPQCAFSLQAAKIAATASQLRAFIRFHMAQIIVVP